MKTQSTHSKKPVIGVFDSGVGGLTVVRELKRMLPNIPLIYFGDTARTPYGTKAAQTIQQFAKEDTEFLLEAGANIIVIACHSAASTATEFLKRTFDCPIFEVVSPSVKEAVRVTENKRIGVIGTRATIESGIYEREIKKISKDYVIIAKPCPLIVPLVEEGWFDRRETKMIVKKYLHPLKLRCVDTLVLGCTHYPMLKNIIQEKIGKRTNIVDPSEEVARLVYNHVNDNFDLKDTSPEKKDVFYFSDLGPVTQEVIKRFIKDPIEVKKA